MKNFVKIIIKKISFFDNLFFVINLPILIILDLLTKYLASIYLTEKINIIGSYFYLDFIENTGIAFGIKIPLIKIITIILIFLIFGYYFKEFKNKKNKLLDISFSLILAGAISNAYGRIFEGKVVDFIGIKYFSVFNLADIFITIGAIVLFYGLTKIKKINNNK